MDQRTAHNTLKIEGLPSFHGESGPDDVPVVPLLHGLPWSSRVFEPLLNRLSDRYYLITPDYPGFGDSDTPEACDFSYTFDHIATVVDRVAEGLGLSNYTLYMQDYGGPISFRIALAQLECVRSQIIRHSVAYNEGLGVMWKKRRAFWADRAGNATASREKLLPFETTRMRPVGHEPNVERYDPDLWTDIFAILNHRGQADKAGHFAFDTAADETTGYIGRFLK